MILLARSVSLCRLILLAQEGTPLLSRIYNDDRQQGSHRCNKKHFHVHRIARSLKSALYSDFTAAKQKCNCYKVGMEKKNVLPCPSTLSTQILPPWASTMCRAMDSPSPVPLPVRDLSTR